MMTPYKDLTFVSDDELLDDHHETLSRVKLQMNSNEECEDLEQMSAGLEIMDIEENKGVENNLKPTDLSHIPLISLTPMTPRSLSPDDEHSTVSLNSSGGSPLFNSQKYKGQMGISGNLNWRPQSPMQPKTTIEAKDFFAYRDSIVTNVIGEVEKLVEEGDGKLRRTWLLTEIDHWDNEKERIVVLCDKSILTVKYDFIGMKKEDCKRIYLAGVERILQGELKYPQRSLAPRLSGIAGGLVGVMKDCIIPTVQGTVESVGSVVLSKKSSIGTNDIAPPSPPHNQRTTPIPETHQSKTSLMSALALDKFEPRTRNVDGIRLVWDEEVPLSFGQKWNPFNKSIPWITFTSHPLLWHKGGGLSNNSFDVESFSRELMDVLNEGGRGGETSPICRIEYKPIIIESYLGIASLLHNANSLGFYKVRGKVSF